MDILEERAESEASTERLVLRAMGALLIVGAFLIWYFDKTEWMAALGVAFFYYFVKMIDTHNSRLERRFEKLEDGLQEIRDSLNQDSVFMDDSIEENQEIEKKADEWATNQL